MGQAAIVTVKTFPYRDTDEEFSNKYHLNDVPDDLASFESFADGFAALERNVYSVRTHIVRMYGYLNDDDPATHVYDLVPSASTVAGTLAAIGAGHVVLPGDLAGTVRWFTGRLSSRGKKIYLRKYFHDVMSEPGSDADKVWSTQLTAYGTFADALMNLGTSLGFDYVGPDGVAPVAYRADPYITTRTLKRRGRRPPT